MPARGIDDILLDWVAAVLLAATVLLSFIQVIARYILLISTPWTEELARLFFVWAVFLGAAIGVKRNLHTRVDFLFVRLPPRAAALLLSVMDVLLAGLAIVMVLYGGQLFLSTQADHSTSLGYPRNWFYVPVPLSGILMLWYLLPGIARRLSSGRATPPGRGT
ncbi:MAG TPA: TRAP transporter small permease [Candidatus Acidoferrum sp.]|nr:TRAP transporter small permease [Candidatus Acidoferrum sp.]